jgi:hypothetical protein
MTAGTARAVPVCSGYTESESIAMALDLVAAGRLRGQG